MIYTAGGPTVLGFLPFPEFRTPTFLVENLQIPSVAVYDLALIYLVLMFIDGVALI